MRETLLLLFGICSQIFLKASGLDDVIHIAIVTCGADRFEESLTSIRSAILTSSPTRELHFHIVHEKGDGNDKRIDNSLLSWKSDRKVQFRIYESRIPLAYVTLFAHCSTHRLFLHEILLDVQKVIYVDSDTIFLSDVADLWDEFPHFNHDTFAAMAAEDEPEATIPYYRPTLPHPYYYVKGGAHGLNAGVMLIHLENLRSDPWNDDVERYRNTFELQFADQDMLNVYFHYHPDRVRVLPCEWNFRSDHCYYGQLCGGIRLLHGSRGIFHKSANQRHPVLAYQLVYDSFAGFDNHEMGTCELVQHKLHSFITKAQGANFDNQCERTVLSVALYRLQELCGAKDEL